LSDFLLDFGEKKNRSTARAIDAMRYYKDILVRSYEFDKFTLILSRVDDYDVWGPYESVDKTSYVAIAGRVFFESGIWEKAKTCPGAGGLASKAIYMMYVAGGINQLECLNGNYVVLIYDRNLQKLHLITDRCGMYPCFMKVQDRNPIVISSHSDILARCLPTSPEWDISSMAAFLMTGKVQYPYTYYKNIRAMDYGCTHSFDLSNERAVYETSKKYYEFNFLLDHKQSEAELAEELSQAVRMAISRRTLSIFGQTAVSLSGGLDARSLLCAAEDRKDIWTFFFYDEKNVEFEMAEKIAKELNVKYIPLKRDYDYYGNNFEMGVRISGGTGNIFNNHHLGFRDCLASLGVNNIVSGFYFDCLFKSLLLSRSRNRFTRIEHLSGTDAKCLQVNPGVDDYWFDTQYANEVKERLYEIFPEQLIHDGSDLAKLTIAHRRLFPIHTDTEHPMVTIPQKVMGWSLPILDNDILDVYLKIPPNLKLNLTLYSKMVKELCPPNILSIPNSSTGARIDASKAGLLFHIYKTALTRRISRCRQSIAGHESWPNWWHYIRKSKKIESLWTRKNAIAEDIISAIAGRNLLHGKAEEYVTNRSEPVLFFRLLTLKLWLDQQIQN
jgi:hypothetical protein